MEGSFGGHKIIEIKCRLYGEFLGIQEQSKLTSDSVEKSFWGHKNMKINRKIQ